MTGERPILDEIVTLEQDIADRIVKLEALKGSLEAAGNARDLLFETGTPLERAVRSALEELGFSVSHFSEGSSEFDAVFESLEGRFIGEVEGREKQINVAKISQIRRNVDEDFALDGVDVPAKGVLFGNGYRLETPSERGECFTDKVISAAPALGISLVRTIDLFKVVQVLRESRDKPFAQQCRVAIANSHGEIVKFPSPTEHSSSH